jgi:hypothetical protein
MWNVIVYSSIIRVCNSLWFIAIILFISLWFVASAYRRKWSTPHTYNLIPCRLQATFMQSKIFALINTRKVPKKPKTELLEAKQLLKRHLRTIPCVPSQILNLDGILDLWTLNRVNGWAGTHLSSLSRVFLISFLSSSLSSHNNSTTTHSHSALN